MTITTQTVLDQREITQNGTIQTRFAKQVISGDVALSSQWHRASFAPGSDVDAQVDAINADLARMGYPSVSDADATAIRSLAQREWTDDVVAAYRAKRAAAE